MRQCAEVWRQRRGAGAPERRERLPVERLFLHQGALCTVGCRIVAVASRWRQVLAVVGRVCTVSSEQPHLEGGSGCAPSCLAPPSYVTSSEDV